MDHRSAANKRDALIAAGIDHDRFDDGVGYGLVGCPGDKEVGSATASDIASGDEELGCGELLEPKRFGKIRFHLDALGIEIPDRVDRDFMVDAGVAFCFMEVSSHAVDQRRIAGLDFDVAGTDVTWLALIVTLFAGLSMVSNIPFYSGKEINLRRKVPFFTILLLVLFFFVLIPSHPPVVLFCLFASYASSGYAIKLWRFAKNRKKTEHANPE